jgi:hypothetical protein
MTAQVHGLHLRRQVSSSYKKRLSLRRDIGNFLLVVQIWEGLQCGRDARIWLNGICMGVGAQEIFQY